MWNGKNPVKCKQSPVYSSSLIVGVASVLRGVVLSQSTFHLVIWKFTKRLAVSFKPPVN